MYKLREIDRKDLQKINAWRNDPELIKFLGAPFRYITPEIDIRWYEAYLSNRNTAIRCAIVDEKDQILGLVSLLSIDNLNRSAEFNIMIGDLQNCGKGIGTFATKQMISHAFNNMNLNRIELTVLEDNIRARKLYEKCGFVLEGTKRDCNYKNGKYVNMCMYAILKKDYIEG